MPIDTLYYDGHCPLCQREIRLLEKWRDERLQLVDVHGHKPSAGEPGRDSMLLRMHLRSGDGVWFSGVDAMVKAWSHTRWGALLKPLRWPSLAPLADRLYEYWARRRYAGLYCNAGDGPGCKNDVLGARPHRQ